MLRVRLILTHDPVRACWTSSILYVTVSTEQQEDEPSDEVSPSDVHELSPSDIDEVSPFCVHEASPSDSVMLRCFPNRRTAEYMTEYRN